MLGAAAAGSAGLGVALVEKNDRLGKKLSITGNGRCNVTNLAGPEQFQNKIITNGKFLTSALNSFSSTDTINLLEALGVPLKVEREGRVFPASDKSGDIIAALVEYLQKCGVEVRLKCEVKQVLTRGGRVSGVLLAGGGRLEAAKVLIATGGMSYRHTGSTGDGYALARALGHTVVSPRPALTPLTIKEAWIRDLQGLALQGVEVQALVAGRTAAKERGEMLFTHYGVSGPAVLNLSSYLSKSQALPAKLKIDLLPDHTEEQLDCHLRELFQKNAGKHLKTALSDLFAQRLVPVLLSQAGLDGTRQVDRVSRAERFRLGSSIKCIMLKVSGFRSLNEAIVTGGGVSIGEINPSTMESKIIGGLYFAGEVIDVDALTGGYNIQIAFSTGYLSGTKAAGAEKVL